MTCVESANLDAVAGKRRCSLFWTLGPNQVGKAAIIGWRDVLTPALGSDKSVVLWPFDGSLDQLLKPGNVVIVETYPAECYGWFFQGGTKRQKKGCGGQE